MSNIDMDEQEGRDGRNSAKIEFKKFFAYPINPVHPC